MNGIGINTEELKEKIADLKVRRDRIREIFADVEKRINAIPDYWQSNTSESMLTDFNALYKEFATINDSNDKYINFLENIVVEDYTNKDNSLDKLIDSNI